MRVLPLLLVAALAVGCTSDKPKAQSVKKYCALTTMPRATASDLQALHDRAVSLFEQRTPYLVTDVNKRVITAATGVTTVSLLAIRQLEQPHLFPGQPKGLGLNQAITELATACVALAKTEKPAKP